MSGLAWQRREGGQASWPAASAAPAAASSVRILLARVLPSMVARGHGLDTLCLYLAIARVALLDLVVALGLPTPHDRPHRKAGGRNPWSPGDVSLFIELWMECWRAGSLAERFGRSPGAIWSKARQLGLPARDRKSLVCPPDPHAPQPAESAQRRPIANLPIATRAFGAAALPAQQAGPAPRAAALVPSPVAAASPVAAPAALVSSDSPISVRPSPPPVAAPALPGLGGAASVAAVPSQDAVFVRAPAAQSKLPVVLSGPELRGPARTGRRAIGLVRAQAQSAPLLPLLVPRLFAELAAAKPNASASVKAIRKLLMRAASDALGSPGIKRRIRQDGRVECDWSPAADLEIAIRHIAGQHDFAAAAELQLSISCLRTRKWVTETPHQIRGQTVEEFNPAWAEETIDAWDLRLQQCHAYRDIKGVEFWFWARNGDGRRFSKRAKSKAWFQECASSGDYAY